MDSIQNTIFDGGMHKLTRLDARDHLAEANVAITINSKGNIRIIKSRFGEIGEIDLCDLLIKLIRTSDDDSFTGSKLLDEPVKNELMIAISQILEKYNL